jgi:NAD(P)-dependent dehydrogenase (short-subunit alcohol dehydrogenase family)
VRRIYIYNWNINSGSFMRAVLVTGAAGGIGCAVVEALSSEGWAVIGTDHPNVVPSSQLLGICYDWIPFDLALLSCNQEEVNKFVNHVFAAAASCDLLGIVHNAALQIVGDFLSLSIPEWLDTFSINLFAPVAISQALLPILESHRGSIVYIGSIHSQLTKPGFTAYATSKAALAGLTRSMAVELGESIRVNAVEPAAIATPMLEAGFASSPDMRAQLDAFHPAGSIGSPDDVARAVLFLLDPANSFLNGCVLPLGGGIHSRLHDPS